MADILIPEDIRGGAIDKLREEFDVVILPELWKSRDDLKQELARAKGVIVRNQTELTKDLIMAATDLQIIGRSGAGLDNIDVESATARGIVVAYTPRENSVSVAELAIGMMLTLSRHLSAADRDTRKGNWNRGRFVGGELLGKNLGIIGYGRIGQLVAQRAAAFGLNLGTYDAFVSPDDELLQHPEVRWQPLESLLAWSDIVTCHVPLTAETRGMFDRKAFGLMKPNQLFINTSRGEVVVEKDLIAALQSGQIAGAALDVREVEPPQPGPLEELDNVVLTPHIAAFTNEAQLRVVEAVCHDVRAVLTGGDAEGFYNFSRPRRT